MSDTCYMRVMCARRDVRLFDSLGLVEDSDGQDPVMAELQDQHCNHASGMGTGEEDQHGWPLHVPFFGWHTAGGEYGALRFVCLGENEVITVPDYDDCVVVRFDSELGQAVAEELHNARAYFRAVTMAQNRIAVRQATPVEEPG